jgi:hypothetical protein
MDGHDRILAVVLAAQHFLGFARFDLRRQLVERPAQVVSDRLTRLRPLHEHREIVGATAERLAQLAVFFQAAAALQELLGRRLILPEVGGGNALFDLCQFGRRTGGVKDSSAGRWRAAPDPRTCEAVRRVG